MHLSNLLHNKNITEFTAEIIKDIINEGIYHGIDETEVQERLKEGYKKMDYPTE